MGGCVGSTYNNDIWQSASLGLKEDNVNEPPNWLRVGERRICTLLSSETHENHVKNLCYCSTKKAKEMGHHTLFDFENKEQKMGKWMEDAAGI